MDNNESIFQPEARFLNVETELDGNSSLSGITPAHSTGINQEYGDREIEAFIQQRAGEYLLKESLSFPPEKGNEKQIESSTDQVTGQTQPGSSVNTKDRALASDGLLVSQSRKSKKNKGKTSLDNSFQEISGDIGRDILQAPKGKSSYRLYGRAGHDELTASKGDRLYGGPGRDVLDASQAKGKNILRGGADKDELYGNKHDRLFGGAQNDLLSTVEGRGKNVLRGGAGNDRLYAGRKDKLHGNQGHDFLDASQGDGKNRLKGGRGNDTLYGGRKDRVFGNKGNDILWAGQGRNRLKGGHGWDQFWIVDNELPTSANTIVDFKVGIDQLGISGFGQITRFEDLDLIQDGNDTVIQFQGHAIAVLKRVNPASLTEDTFLFAPTRVPGQPWTSVPLEITKVSTAAQYKNEMGVFIVDDAHGRIGDLLPGDAGYARAALSSNRHQVVVMGNQTNGTKTVVNVPSGSYLGWYLIQNSTTETFLQKNPRNKVGNNPQVFFSFLEANPDGIDHLHYHSGNQLVWEDLTYGGDRDFRDLVAHFEFKPVAVSPGRTISVDDLTVVEGSGSSASAFATVALSGPSDVTVMVEFSTADVSARAGQDYQAVNGTLEFKPGETQKRIEIPIVADTEDEPDEEFQIILRNAHNAEIADGEAIGTILDDDDAPVPALPTLSIDDVSVIEGDDETTRAVFTVMLSTPSDKPVTLNFETVEGAALAGQDYQAVQGQLTFLPGESITQTIEVPIIGDLLDEVDEAFTLKLTNPVNATLLTPEVVATILNDDQPGEIILLEGTRFQTVQEHRFDVPQTPAVRLF
ncbi:MAG: Calx-beta domain-containing protein [Elainellaceae cyanobacterium]